MIRYSFLNNTRVNTLHHAFLGAFAEYQVNMQMSLEDFEFHLRRDGVDTSISVGAFDDDQLVGFCFNGSGTWEGEPTVYDAGTGVLPQHRRKGIAAEMFRFTNPQLKERGFSRYLLEVLTSNEPAVNLYRRLGFIETRRFAVFRARTRPSFNADAVAEIRRVEVPDWKLYQTFWTGYPSWQNSIEAVQRVVDTTVTVECHVDHRCVGYGMVSKASDQLIQLAVDPGYRRRGLASKLLDTLQNCVTSTVPIKVNNVDENLKDATAFFEAVGFSLVLEQYEMILNL
jgi:ribosomal protein S18 acetylase RimI-like enzyme